jgi:homoserine dehydrogenase
VQVVVETIGGLKPAYAYVKAALESGRHVATSNKELVATHGAELLRIAKEHGVCFLFEASVGGGTPVITPLHQCLAANTITDIAGIVNGTTNFMLTKMAREGMSFDEALKIAQQLGYAETIDPSADVDGIDAQRKIAILASLAFGYQFYPQSVPTRGIRSITVEDIAFAARQNAAVKLIAWAHQAPDGAVSLGVEPMLVPHSSQIAGVDDVFNAVQMRGDMLGDVLFYGKGAGKLPTASAVVADVIDALKNGVSIHDSLFWAQRPPVEGMYSNTTQADFYVRLENTDAQAARAVFGEEIALIAESGSTVVFTVRDTNAAQVQLLCAQAQARHMDVGNVLKWLAE